MNQDKYMNVALMEAAKAYKVGEVPVGAIIVLNNKIIAKAHNLVEKKNNATYHAEILAIKKASKKLKNWRLNDCDMYVTLEPCEMCRGAIKVSRIRNVYYAAKGNNADLKIDKNYFQIQNYEEKCLKLLQSFFKSKRN